MFYILWMVPPSNLISISNLRHIFSCRKQSNISWRHGPQAVKDHSEQKSQTDHGGFVFRMIFRRATPILKVREPDVKYIKRQKSHLNSQLDRPRVDNIYVYKNIIDYWNKIYIDINGYTCPILTFFNTWLSLKTLTRSGYHSIHLQMGNSTHWKTHGCAGSQSSSQDSIQWSIKITQD